MATINIDIAKFENKFSENYDFLYANHDNVAGYHETLAFGDEFITKNIDFVMEFNAYRHDILSSDREVAAFAFTLDDFCLV